MERYCECSQGRKAYTYWSELGVPERKVREGIWLELELMRNGIHDTVEKWGPRDIIMMLSTEEREDACRRRCDVNDV